MKARTRKKEMEEQRSGDSVEVTVRPLQSALAFALCPRCKAFGVNGRKASPVA
jgi:hypothetical protein